MSSLFTGFHNSDSADAEEQKTPELSAATGPETASGRWPTLVDLLRYRAATQPDRTAYTFLHNGEQPFKSLTYGELDRQARSIAVWLTERPGFCGQTSQGEVAQPGQRAILVQKAGPDFLAAFLGCLYAGVEAIALVPPHLSAVHASMEIFRAIVAAAHPRFIFADPLLFNQRERVESEFGVGGLDWADLEAVLADQTAAERWVRPDDLNPATISHLQYTSGSTSRPKGVAVSHANILANVSSLGYAYNPDSITVNWLPHYHDMGLVNGLLQPLYSGFHCYSMAPAAFMQKPLRWLQGVTSHRATHIIGPNFAYELCLRRVKPEQLARLDLSSLEVAISGAEPVRWETMQSFSETFGPAGFRFDAFQPAYGLAEATLGVSIKIKGERPRYLSLDSLALQTHRLLPVPDDQPGSLKVVSCGPLYAATEVVIVDPLRLTRADPDAVGEIWLRGPGIAHGYTGQPELTAQTFEAYLSTGEGPFLRTGDLGFMQNGELFISGRSKDLIIIRGRNHWPQDLERTVEEILPDFFKVGGSAAFSVEHDREERLVIAAEVRGDSSPLEFEEVEEAVRRVLAERHDLSLYELVLLKPNGLPKTTSGKVQRQATRLAWLNKTLEKYLGK